MKMDCTIEWNSLDLAGWEERFSRIRRSTLPQSYDYARAVCPLYGQRPAWGIIRFKGRDAGLVQILEARLFGRALHAFSLDRGPLWFSGFGGAMHIKAFCDELNRQFPRRFGRRRRIIPELPKSPSAAGLVRQAGLVPSGPDYTTVWLDLTPALDDLRAGLKGNWRNHLNKAEKGPLSVEWRTDSETMAELVAGYQADQAARAYPGPAPRVVRAMGRGFAEKGHALIGRALLDNRAVASILILCHGCSATYQVGWSDTDGRRHGGHYRLLWSAMETLKNKGISDFDLGGLNDDKAEGVSAFKDGMGGQRVTLAGLFI
jgi:hypothetical protein